MKLHLGGIGDYVQDCITTEHVDPATPTADDMRKKKEHNQAMLEIASSLNYVEFDDIKDCETTKSMWDSLHTIYGGDKNVQRAKSKSLRSKFDDMEWKKVRMFLSMLLE